VNAPVVDDVGFDDFPAVALHDFGQGESQQVVTDMSQVKGLVGVGGGVFDHDHFGVVFRTFHAVIFIFNGLPEKVEPYAVVQGDIQETIDDVKASHFGGVGPEVCAECTGHFCRAFPGGLYHGKDHQGQIPFEFLTCLLQLKHRFPRGEAEELFHPFLQGFLQEYINIHYAFFRAAKIVILPLNDDLPVALVPEELFFVVAGEVSHMGGQGFPEGAVTVASRLFSQGVNHQSGS